MSRHELWDQVDGNLYDVLGVADTADSNAIAEAWKRAAKNAHPDSGGTVAGFQQIELAYRVLSDPLERRRYDRSLTPTTSDRERPGTTNSEATRPARYPSVPTTVPPSRREGPPSVGEYWNPGPARPVAGWTIALVVALLAAVLIAVAYFFSEFAVALPLIAGAGVIAWTLNRGRGR